MGCYAATVPRHRCGNMPGRRLTGGVASSSGAVAAQMAMAFYVPEIAATTVGARPLTEADWGSGVVVRAVNWLGDTLMAMPAVYQLRRALPECCSLWVVCPGSLTHLWRASRCVSDIFPLHGNRIDADLARTLRGLRAGVGVVLPNSFSSALDIWRIGMPVRAGRAGRCRRLLLNRTSPGWRSAERYSATHQVSHYLDVVSLLVPVERRAVMPPLAAADIYREAAREAGIRRGTRCLVMAPGAAYGPAKQWPTEAFARVAEQWRNDIGPVAVVGSPKERGLGEQIRSAHPGILNLCGTTTLDELMGVLAEADVCLCNDSGTMHLAAALGACGVAVFGSTNPKATGPLGGRWMVLSDPPGCAPCFARQCIRPEKDYRCLRGIGPDVALNALTWLIHERR